MQLNSIADILQSQYGNVMSDMAKATGLSEITIAKYRYDWNCELHVVIDGELYTRHKTTKRFNIDHDKVPGFKVQKV